MREIKFRIFHDGTMYYLNKGDGLRLCFFSEGIPWGLYESSTDARIVTGDPDAILNTPGVLMQFTGREDKKGSPIYEGDIIECEYHTQFIDKEDPKIWRGVVEYHESHTHFSVISKGQSYSVGFGGSAVKRWEVIGNIHQNPELLTL